MSHCLAPGVEAPCEPMYPRHTAKVNLNNRTVELGMHTEDVSEYRLLTACQARHVAALLNEAAARLEIANLHALAHEPERFLLELDQMAVESAARDEAAGKEAASLTRAFEIAVDAYAAYVDGLAQPTNNLRDPMSQES